MPAIAKLEIPNDALLLYEHMTIKAPDRSGNWRFTIHSDGCFFNARNTQLFVTDSALLNSDDPASHWNTPFPSDPDRCLSQAQLAELNSAIEAAKFGSLSEYYPTPRGEQVSDQYVERWSVVLENSIVSVVVENGFAPRSLADLRTTIDRLVAEAP